MTKVGIPAQGMRISVGGWVGKISSIDGALSSSHAMIETTHLETPEPIDGEVGGKTFLRDPLGDPGALTLSVFHEDGNPPVQSDPDNPMPIEITLRKPVSKATAPRILGEGWLQDVSLGGAVGGVLTWSITVKWTGLVRLVEAS